MSSLTGLSSRQTQTLWAVWTLTNHRTAATGRAMLLKFQASALEDFTGLTHQGLHQTASSLVKRGLLTKGHTGTHTIAYTITSEGQMLLNREIEVHGRLL